MVAAFFGAKLSFSRQVFRRFRLVFKQKTFSLCFCILDCIFLPQNATGQIIGLDAGQDGKI